jgi:hypothetical protein
MKENVNPSNEQLWNCSQQPQQFWKDYLMRNWSFKFGNDNKIEVPLSTKVVYGSKDYLKPDAIIK